MGIDLKVTLIIIQIHIVRIVRLNVLRRNGNPIRRLTGTRGIHHRDITVHRSVFFRVLRQVISLAALHVVMEGIRLIHLQGVAGVRLGTDIHLRGKVPRGGIHHPEGSLTHLKGIERDTVHQVMVDMVKIIATIIEVIGLQPIGMALDISLRGLRRGLVVRRGNGKYPRI